MSLIEQALRKVQDPVLRAAQATTEAPPQPAEAGPAPAHSWPVADAPAKPPETTNAPVIVASAILSLAVVLVVAGAVWLGHTLRTASPPAPSVSAASAAPAASDTPSAPMAAAPVTETRPKGAQASGMSFPNPLFLTDVARISKSPVGSQAKASLKDALVLSGIVQGSGDPYALINDTIVAVGETIHGRTLVEIGNGMARLRDADGDETILRVPR